MGLLNKFKNMFTEEIEEEPIKKEVIKVEIPAPTIKKEEPKINVADNFNDESDDISFDNAREFNETRTRSEKFSFPVFDDNDFETVTRGKNTVEKPKENKNDQYKAVPKSEAYKGTVIKREAPRVFKPTPIISPIYGILGENYKKEDIKSKEEVAVMENKEVTVDEVREKAFGTLEDEIEKTMEVSKNDETKDETKETNDDARDLFFELEDNSKEDLSLSREERHKDLLTNDFYAEDNMVADEINNPHDEDDDVDLFNLIDSMYDDKEDEEE